MVSTADVDRVFLQATLSRGILSGDLARTLWQKSIAAVNASNNALDIDVQNNNDNWGEFVKRINGTLDTLDLDFRSLHDELTGKEMYAVVNRKGDLVAQMATDYSPAEIAFFRAIVEQIMLCHGESYSISSLAALRELTIGKSNMTKIQGEIVLSSFVSKGWLLKSARGRYSLSARSILELQQYLKTTYPDAFLECTICMEMVTVGVACTTPACQARLHLHCFKNYRQRQGQKKCPNCNGDWGKEIHELKPIGERAIKDGQHEPRHGPRKARDDSDDTDEEEEEEEATRTPSPPRKEKKGKGKKKQREESMEVDEDDDDEPTQKQTQRLRRGTRH